VLSKDGKIKIKQGRLNKKERISEEASGREREKRDGKSLPLERNYFNKKIFMQSFFWPHLQESVSTYQWG